MADSPLRHRNYRVMRVSSCGVEDAGSLLYRDDEGLRCASYSEQQRSWLERKVGCGEAFLRAMKSRGHDVRQVLCDLEPLQRTWAWERGIEVDEQNWKSQILLQQILDYKPEVLFLQGFESLPAPLRLTIKKQVPSIDLLVIQQGSCNPTPTVLRELARADLLFVSSPALANACRKAGLTPNLVYDAFDPSVLCELPAPSKLDPASLCGATFLGTTGKRADHARRERYLARLLEDGLLDVYARQLNANGRIRRGGPRLGGSANTRVHDPQFGIDYFELLQRSRVTLDVHCDSAGGYVGNRRMFEATGVGTCLLTDRGANLPDLFEDGREVVTFSGLADACDKLRYLLEHEDERAEIAAAGQARTLKEHTVHKRVAEIDSWIQQGLAVQRKATRTRWRGLPGSLPT
ncbi:MAG: glycosyltransferase [Myxococcota bacterium]|jgi:hypothetical protein|nr:glycosyltransferase [Myxococcota bacterium]